MTESDLIWILDLFASRHIELWIDGGWAVDALIGRQSRSHEDLDIAIESRFVPAARMLLASNGFHDVARNDTTSWNFVLGDDRNRCIDFHVIDLDQEGNGLYGPPADGAIYPAAALTGRGTIGDRQVCCISVEYCVRFRSGWPLRPCDCADLRTLQSHFGIDLPDDFATWCV